MLNFGYWMFLFGGIFLYVMFFLNTGPDTGWFSYVPLAGPEFGAASAPTSGRSSSPSPRSRR